MGGKVTLRGHGAAGSGAVHEECAVGVCLGLKISDAHSPRHTSQSDEHFMKADRMLAAQLPGQARYRATKMPARRWLQ